MDQYLVDQWGISDGIPSDSINSIAQTPDGYLWIATNKGLVRFDGIGFSTIEFVEDKMRKSLEVTVPQVLFVDRQGTLWIGGFGFLSYRYQTNRFKTFTTDHGITLDSIRCIKDDIKGNLWIGLWASCVNRFSQGKFTDFNESHGLTGKKINAIVETGNGNLLFGSRENGVFIYKDGNFSRYPIPGLDNDFIIFMYEDRKGELWIGTNHGLIRVNDRGTRRYTARDGLSDEYITRMMEDSDRNLWVGTVKGLNRIKKKPGTVDIDIKILLDQFTIRCFFEDREKSLWVGTDDSGIKRLKEGKIIPYTPLEAYHEEIFFSLFEDRDEDTWVGALGKLFRCRDNGLIESVKVPGISGIAITSIADDTRGNLWLGTSGAGVFQEKNGSFVQISKGLADGLVTSIYRDSQGSMWCSTPDGVSVIRFPGDNNHIIKTLNSRNGLSGKVANNVFEDKTQNIWIAADNGITVLKGGKLEKKNIAYYLEGNYVTCVYEDPSVPDSAGNRIYWAATRGAGFKRLELATDTAVTSYTSADGMTTDFFFQFFEDTEGNFWLLSDSGILRVNKNELNQFADKGRDSINCISFDLSDGMKSLELNNALSRNSALKTRKGEFWFITKKGISIVNPARIKINKSPPLVVIEKVLFNRQDALQEITPTGVYSVKGITDFRFRFTAPTFLSPEKIKFRYRLEGYDRDWVSLAPGKDRVAEYQNLEPGAYTFTVTACNAEGVWNRLGASITFTLQPLFHQTFLFKAILLLLLLLMAAVVYYILKKRPFNKKTEIKYKDSPLDPRAAQACIKKLRHLVEIKKVYKDPNISLQSLAEKLSVSHHLLSRVLNERMNQKFFDFINFHRVEEAKRILQEPGSDQQKIVTVAFEVGFNTVVAFYNSFKKFTNMTPTQFRKMKGGRVEG